MAVFLGSKSSISGVLDYSYLTIKSAEFCRVDFKAFEDRDVVVFDSLSKDSLLTNVCIDFSLKELSASCSSKYWFSFNEFFSGQGFKGDHLKYGYYSTSDKEEVQKLASLLLQTNVFPKLWLPFFQAIAKEGKWIIESKKDSPDRKGL